MKIPDIWSISMSLRPVYEALEALEASVEAIDAVEAAGSRIDGDSNSFSTGWGWWSRTLVGLIDLDLDVPLSCPASFLDILHFLLAEYCGVSE